MRRDCSTHCSLIAKLCNVLYSWQVKTSGIALWDVISSVKVHVSCVSLCISRRWMIVELNCRIDISAIQHDVMTSTYRGNCRSYNRVGWYFYCSLCRLRMHCKCAVYRALWNMDNFCSACTEALHRPHFKAKVISLTDCGWWIAGLLLDFQYFSFSKSAAASDWRLYYLFVNLSQHQGFSVILFIVSIGYRYGTYTKNLSFRSRACWPRQQFAQSTSR